MNFSNPAQPNQGDSTTKDRIEYLEIDPAFRRNPIAPKLPIYLPVVQFFIGILSSLFPKLTSKIAFRLFRTPRKRAKHSKSDKILEAARIEEIIVGTNTLKFYTWGGGDKNILLVHGWESRGTALRAFAKPLTNQGYKVIAIDLPAHGDSTGRHTSIPESAAAITTIIHKFKGIEAIITHSYGGLALAYASRKMIPNQPIPKAIMMGVPLNFSDLLLKIERLLNISEKVLPYVHEIIFDITGEYPSEMNIPAAAQQTKIEQLLILHDKNDQISSIKNAQEINEAWSNSHLVITEGLGHYRILKNKQAVERVVDFIVKNNSN